MFTKVDIFLCILSYKDNIRTINHHGKAIKVGNPIKKNGKHFIQVFFNTK